MFVLAQKVGTRDRVPTGSTLVPAERMLRIAALRWEGKAVPLRGIARIVRVKLRHEIAE